MLGGLHVVEVAGRYSGRVAGAVLAALGADVTRITTADDERDEYPLVAPDGSASALALDRNKRVLRTTADNLQAELAAALDSADVLITSGENTAEIFPMSNGHGAQGLTSPEGEGARGPITTGGSSAEAGDPVQRRFGMPFGGVHVDITPYGATGPCRAWKATDLTIGAHAGGAAYIGEAGREPLVPPIQLASHQAGLAAAAAALAAAPGTTVDVAEFDVLATTHVSGLYPLAFFSGPPPHRAGRRKPAPYPFTHLPCADGSVCIAFLEGRHWAKFVEAMGTPAWTTEDQYRNRRVMGEQYPDEVDALVIDWLRTKTKADLRELALERRLPIAPLRTLDDLLESEQLAARRFFESVETGEALVRVPGLPFAITPSGANQAEPRPLAGRIVLDLGRVASAPAVGQWLADLGADVIKVESRSHLDSSRKGRPLLAEDVEAADAGQAPNLTPYFQVFNRGKRSLTLDLACPDGRAVLERLIPPTAVLVENFGAGGLERFGLGPDRLHALNPDLVVVRISAVGQTGPESALPGYAPHSTAAAGLDNLCGYADGEPAGMIASNFGDINTGAFGSVAALAALRAGEGCTIDLSMLEANATHLAPLLVRHQQFPADLRPAGNAHQGFAPHGIYPTADNGWLAVAARTAAERAALAAAIGDALPVDGIGDVLPVDAIGEALPAEGGVAHAGASRSEAPASADASSASLEEAVRAWVLGQGAADGAQRLQAAGVPAAPVLATEDLLWDEHARSRDVVVEVPHPVLGVVPVHGVPFRSGDLMAVRGRSPDLGEHTVEILTAAGYSPGEIDKLEAAGALDGPAAQ